MTDSQATIKEPAALGSTRGFWRGLKARLWPAPLTSVRSLKIFLEERAALIAQKCAIDYCRGKTGLASSARFTGEPFLKALDVCRWETFVTVLGDLLIILEGSLRQHVTAAQQPRLCEALVGLYSEVLDRMPPPAHRAHGWADAIASFASRLKEANLTQPRLALDVADHSAKRLFDTLPIHSSMRALDEEVVYGAVRFRMIAVRQEMQRRVPAAELAERLLAVS